MKKQLINDGHEADYAAAEEGRLGADRMALGLSSVPDKYRGDMDMVRQLRDLLAEHLHDKVWPGEHAIEHLWKESRGVQRETGAMWLTPRMERIAKRLQETWDKEEQEFDTETKELEEDNENQ